MLPTVLKYYIDADQGYPVEKAMTQATLYGYQLHQFAEESTPVITPSSDPADVVDGMLIFNLDHHQRNAIYEFEGGLMCLSSVQVSICQREHGHLYSMRSVEAGTFVWSGSKEGLIPLKSVAWSVDSFLESPFYKYISDSQYRTAAGLGLSTIREFEDDWTPSRSVQDCGSSLYSIEEESEPAWY